MMLPKESATFSSCRFNFFMVFLIPNSRYQIDVIDGVQIRKKKVNRPKALCFDYLQLKETFGIDLETEVLLKNET